MVVKTIFSQIRYRNDEENKVNKNLIFLPLAIMLISLWREMNGYKIMMKNFYSEDDNVDRVLSDQAFSYKVTFFCSSVFSFYYSL